jgi:hypothetical protein
MEYDPRGQYGHLGGGPGGQPHPPQPQARPPAPPLTFGGVFWACFLALTVWSLLAWLVLGAMIENASSDF